LFGWAGETAKADLVDVADHGARWGAAEIGAHANVGVLVGRREKTSKQLPHQRVKRGARVARHVAGGDIFL